MINIEKVSCPLLSLAKLMALSVVWEAVHAENIAGLGIYTPRPKYLVEILNSLKSMAKMLLLHTSLAFISRSFLSSYVNINAS